ncbi:MAG TPA: prepilin-type N-terminal cleavage/methylation domain-containing protein [Dehalococcoidia bacterium]|nr:prepilin-type N-terminal cleavage/methylation domain-containing protein [Dehalococcoidia bacterium]
MKRIKNLGLMRPGGKRGFTLIELLIVLIIISILASIVVLSAGGIADRARQIAYDEVRSQIQNAVIVHLISSASFPVTGTTINIDGDPYNIIDICALTGPEGLLTKVPTGCWQGTAEDDDNCAGSGNASCTGCETEAHYTWAIGTRGEVISVCKNTDANGGGCSSDASDDYQGVWP